MSVGVVTTGALTLWKGWTWLGPLASLAVAAAVMVGTLLLFRQSLRLLFDGVPEGIHLADIRRALEGVPGVARVHHLLADHHGIRHAPLQPESAAYAAGCEERAKP